jgi:UDP-3-O-[3-hydroxymyristoyl] N-acetylglucosamine deacetylase
VTTAPPAQSEAAAQQSTLRAPVQFEGVGLHTGRHASVDVRPAPPDTGLIFVLRHPGGEMRVPAVAEHVVDTSRATVLGKDGITVSTTEHLLSALYGMGVTNAEIAVDGPEIPVVDGSASAFVAAIDRAGVELQDAAAPVMHVEEPLVLRNADRLVAVLPSPHFRVRFLADFPAPIGTQYFDETIDAARYRDDVAGARTFGYLHEVEALRARGLALGGSLENAVVFAPDGPMQPLRWENEVVRHKVLDLIGDLALLGARPQFEVLAIKSGHELHASVTRMLRRTQPLFAAEGA